MEKFSCISLDGVEQVGGILAKLGKPPSGHSIPTFTALALAGGVRLWGALTFWLEMELP